MPSTLRCPSKLYVPTGTTGSLSATIVELITVLPAIKHKVYVSFNVDDCKAMNMEVLHEDALDQAITLINQDKSFVSKSIDALFNLFKTKELSLADKKQIVLQANKYTLNGYLKLLETQDLQYYKDLISHLSCLTNLKFEIVDNNLYSKNTEEYKISICGVNHHILRDNLQEIAHAYVSLGQNPNQCFIAIDDEALEPSNEVLQYRHNTLGHEFLHCLGLNHPSYKNLRANKAHRSIMEDKTPIMESCNKSYGKKWLECMNVPPMPTGEDICALNSLYGNSVNESSICQAIKEEFVTKYPSLTLEVSGSNGAEHSEL